MDNDFEPSRCHILPCEVDYDGPVDNSKFEVKLDEEQRVFRSKLRGRPLTGRQIDLTQHSYTGYYFKSADAEHASGPLVAAKDTADSLILWSYGPENSGDPCNRIEELLAFSNAMIDE